MIKWRFPSNDYGENKGINDSGVAMFRGTPLKSLAREICQNSLDASVVYPVKLEFSLFEMPTNKIPGKEELKETFERCLDFWKSQKAVSTKEHFTAAKKSIVNENCHVLRISDFNTCGLTGSREEINTNWTNLTKSSGASDKKGTAGGSYGIGKFAPFACSDYSTVFYSTYDNEKNVAYQGVSRLVTFTREDGQNTQGIGYFGEEKNTPVFEQLSLDKKFIRKEGEFGTDVYVMGYKYAGNGWEKDLLISVLDGFLGAIWNERLTVKIGEIEVTKANLQQLIDIYKDDLTGYTDKYFDVLISEETDWYTDNLLGLGEVKLGLLLGDPDAPKRVAMIRQTGMKIKDKDRLPGHVPFVGVMFINGDEINRRLRLIENPEHTEWQPQRSSNPFEETRLLQELNRFIRSRIEELVSQGSSQEMDAVGVGNFLPDVEEEAKNTAEEETVSNKVMEMEKKKVKRKATTQPTNDDSDAIDIGENSGGQEGGEDEDVWTHPGGTTNTPGDRPPDEVIPTEKDTTKAKQFNSVALNRFIPICINRKQGKYALNLIPGEDGKDGVLELYLSAETQSYKAPVKSAKVIGGNCELSDNCIKGLEFIKDQQLKIILELDYDEFCSMEVKAYAIKE